MAQQQTKLTRDELTNINRVEHNMSALLVDLDKADNCGMECNELRTLAQQMIDECQRLRNNFG